MIHLLVEIFYAHFFGSFFFLFISKLKLTLKITAQTFERCRRNNTFRGASDSQKNIKDMQAAKERLADLKRIRFFMINQVGPDADIERKGSALGANREREEEADLFAKPRPTAARHPKSMGTRGPGGRIVERKKK